jgi:hypothetical protein
MANNFLYKFSALAVTIAALTGCGGNDSAVSTKTAYFIDSAVEGLEYSSGSTTGVTGTDGSFKYEDGKPVTFKIGGLNLGSLTVTNSRVFPVDLVSGATDETNSAVTLMAKILQTLDSDGDSSNGITITSSARQAITQTIQLASTDPAAATTAINQFIASATSGNSALGKHTSLISDGTAQAHLKGNLLQQYAGTWTGSYTGNDTGTCTFTITPSVATAASPSATIAGSCSSTQFSAQQGGLGTLSAMNFPSSGSFRGALSNGATFIGNFARNGTMTGTWSNGTSYSGAWTLTKQ